MNSLIDLIIKGSRYMLAAILLISLPMLYSSLHQKFFNHVDIFFEENDPDILFYKKFQKTYGNEELAVILFTERDIFTMENIELIRKMTSRIDKSEGISRVFSLTNAKEAVGTEDTVIFRRIIPEGELDQQSLTSIRRKALTNNTLVNNLISREGKTTAILIELEPIRDNMKKREILMGIMNSCNEIAGRRTTLHFAGVPYVEVELNSLTQNDFFTFTPIIFLITFLIVTMMLKNISLSLLCQLNLLLSLIWGVGIFSLCGETLNMVTMIMGAVLLAIAVADSIHILSHYREMYALNGGNHVDAVRDAVRYVWLPCLFTSLTTGIGFFSFITSSIRPVKILGVFTSIGVMVAFILTITFLPATLILMKGRFGEDGKDRFDQEAHRAGQLHDDSLFMKVLINIGRLSTGKSKTIFIIFLSILAITIAGALRIEFETNTMNYLPDDSTIRNDINYIENNFGGTIPFVLLVRAKSQEFDFNHYESLKLIDEIQGDLMKGIKQFSTSLSITDYFKEINQAFNGHNREYYRIPENRLDILDFYEIGDPDILDRIIAPDRMEARISFQSRWDSNETAKGIDTYISRYMKNKLGDNYTYKFTGLSSLYLHMEFNLKESQIRSFLLAFVIIFAMMFFVCGNVKLTILSMIPNLFPIILTLGIMGWYKIPLDVSTIMIASITIGIAVDDTIHFIVWFKRNLASGMDIQSSLMKTFRDVGKPIAITSIVLFLGFFILIMGSIKPTQAFGVLTALAMLFAVMGDLFILPALLMIFKPGIKQP
jgi:predicted RND superfamily exporter protein